ncbi:TetR family transcriptional regulator [Cohnella zeiphila]|uniref:TetR/AcrR family transcriptional regulator n=1 Tax=Cohnella zeiphila TaxID=2761120 RepID=A0A7X0VTX5_9BACL|nr:TetR/AcrR family transcriptional regulator [Cohnella zeiphila]
MGTTKQEIVLSAGKLFALRGFPDVSIQDIADDCRIAKGSVYKYFPSKEDLFNEVFEQIYDRYFDEAERIRRLPGLTEREHFVKQLVFRFQYFLNHRRILVEYQDLPIRQDAKFMPLRLRIRGRLMNWHQACLLSVYGEQLRPYVWDLVFLYKAMLKEYLYWLAREQEQLSIERTAEYILKRLDGLSAQLIAEAEQPLLTAASFERYLHWGREGEPPDREQWIGALLDKLAESVNEVAVGDIQRGELRELASIVREEALKEQRSHPLLLALLSYLEREEALRSPAAQLRHALML